MSATGYSHGGASRPAPRKPSDLPRARRLLPTRRGLRATVAASRPGTLPRSRADRWLLLALTLVVAFAALLAVAVPRLLTRTYDEGVRDAVAHAGAKGEVVVEAPIAVQGVNEGGLQNGQEPQLVQAETLRQRAATIRENLPPAVLDVAGYLGQTVTSGLLVTNRVAAPGEPWGAPEDRINVTLAAVLGGGTDGAAPAPALRYLDGAAPEVGTAPTKAGVVPVAVSKAAADRLGLVVGSRLRGESSVQHRIQLRVTGIFEPVAPGDPGWQLAPALIHPEEWISATQTYVSIAALLAPSGLPAAELAVAPAALSHTTRVAVDPSALDSRSAPGLAAAVADLRSDASDLLPNHEGVAVAGGLDEVLRGHARTTAAVRAQLSLVLVGVVGAAAVVLVLGTHLLITRRRGWLALERARGASTASVGYRLLLESLALTAVGCGAGAVAAVLLVPDVTGSPAPLVVVVAVAALTAPLVGAWTARRAWTSRRTPANRRARGRIAAGARARRLVAEGTVIVLAAAAVVALRNRGLVSAPSAGATGGVDLLLAAAPLLLALAATIVVLHLYGYPIRLVAALARRGRGGVLHLAASRAQQALSTLPLLALTVGFALVVAAGLVRGTLAQGQELASWERVVGDARLSVPVGTTGRSVSEPQIEALRSADGVREVVPALVTPGAQLRVGSAYDRINVVALDAAGFDRLLRAGPVRYAGEFGRLGQAQVTDGALPAVVTPDAAERLSAQTSSVYIGQSFFTVKPMATAGVTAEGWLTGPVVYVDREALLRVQEQGETAGLEVSTVWVSGPGAAAAVAEVANADQVVQSRAAWLAGQQASGLIDDLLRLLWLAVAAVGALAAVALVETVLSGARERGRTLSFVRTLGFTIRQGRWLTLGELVPLVLTGVVAGTLAGVATVALLGPALGLVVTTGGVTAPAPAFDGSFALAVGGCALGLLLVAVLVETASRRRDRLAEVLRVGEAR